jgi:hypothetical protein
MNNEILLQFIRPELMILVAALYCLGLFLKKMPWFTAEWAIPLILLVIGIALTILYLAIILAEGFTQITILMGLIQGILVAAVAVFFNETVKQVFVKRIEDNSKLRG